MVSEQLSGNMDWCNLRCFKAMFCLHERTNCFKRKSRVELDDGDTIAGPVYLRRAFAVAQCTGLHFRPFGMKFIREALCSDLFALR